MHRFRVALAPVAQVKMIFSLEVNETGEALELGGHHTVLPQKSYIGMTTANHIVFL